MKYLIVGLGNIGPEYEMTRHNIGFMVIDHLAGKLKVDMESDRLATTGIGKFKGRQFVLAKPTTYMNLSGKAVRYHMDKHKIPLENVLVITDDLALPFGRLRMRGKGSDGGHNGLKNIQEILGTASYARMKFGIGADFAKGAQVNYVLNPFSVEEQEALPDLIKASAEGALSFGTIGISRTMNAFNTNNK
ncbi:aminoacyl-tRNA hydrolase [Pontibacter sp. G13]|uniref:aminoacyl-tRNA hydrolase n=1 Tax=Pontibacter sp. G13 TaxID=3074898 RepID=UPI0028895F13|nr:aminoacyl-tRNA hydrolase [Pontibacter sp. G13]WNJ21225.1 aminoacyl-tRNA hydrolase [Pontibacter sp. G13]